VRHFRLLPVLIVLAALAAEAASAQSRALFIYGQGGRDLPLSNLIDTGDKLRAGWMTGAGAGLQLGTNLAFRASLARVENEYEGTELNIVDSTFVRTLVSLDLQAGIPTSIGFVPYFIAGAGWIKVDPDDLSLEEFTKFSGRLGTGIHYVLDNSFLVLFAELDTWFYHFDEYGFNRIQYDITVIGGLAVAIPF
jgi:opacity protein-like surface antigen